MDEDFLDVTQKGNKLIALFLFLIIGGLCAFGYFFVYAKFQFSLKNITMEVGSDLSYDVNNYVKNKLVDTSGYKLDLTGVDKDSIGTYTYKVIYNRRVKRGKIKVVDTTPPKFEVEDYTIEVGEDFYLGNILKSCEEISKPCIVSLKNAKDEDKFKKPGVYNVKVTVSDIYKNSADGNVKITVVEKGTLVRKEEIDLEYSSASKGLIAWKNEYFVKFSKALNPESEEAKEKASEITIDDIEKYVTENYPDYKITSTEIIDAYNKSGYIIGYIVEVGLKGEKEKTIYIDNYKSQN